MKFLAYVVLVVVFGTSSVSAAIEQCRFNQSKVDREACYERQAQALAARRKPAVVDEARTQSLDDMIEHYRVSKSLRSICRGC